jgi:hypothetical protein
VRRQTSSRHCFMHYFYAKLLLFSDLTCVARDVYDNIDCCAESLGLAADKIAEYGPWLANDTVFRGLNLDILAWLPFHHADL